MSGQRVKWGVQAGTPACAETRHRGLSVGPDGRVEL